MVIVIPPLGTRGRGGEWKGKQAEMVVVKQLNLVATAQRTISVLIKGDKRIMSFDYVLFFYIYI